MNTTRRKFLSWMGIAAATPEAFAVVKTEQAARIDDT